MTIYKPGQGYWTRMLSAGGAGVLILAGALWLWDQLQTLEHYRVYIQTATVTVIFLGFGSLLWYLLNKPRIVDFMIATEAEMRKVNWPTRREIIGSTWVVIIGTFLIALLLFVVDMLFFQIFHSINIIQG